MKKSRLLIAALALALVFCMTATALAAGPALVVTGTGIVDDLENMVVNENAFSLDELKAIESLTQYYSAVNDKATQSVFLGEGISLKTILAACGYTGGGIVKVVADDGYAAEINLDEERFYYPDFSEGNKAAVPAMLAWASGGKRGNYAEGGIKGKNAPDIPTTVTPLDGLKSYIGQLNLTAVNHSAFVQGIVLLIVGDERSEAALTINGEPLNRAEVMRYGYDNASYSYSTMNGDKVENVIGVYLADLLADFDIADTDMLSFAAADGYDVSGYDVTFAEAKAKNYMLAYKKLNGDKWENIYNTAKNSDAAGYFVLYGDGVRPAKMIDSITTAAGASEPAAPAASGKSMVLTLGSAKASIDGAAVTMDVAPEVVTVNGGGVTFVPLRFVTENLGLANNWSADAPQDVVLTGAGFNGKIVIGSTAATINGAARTLLAAPYVNNSRTMVPLRFISENLGYSVDYDAATQTITIK